MKSTNLAALYCELGRNSLLAVLPIGKDKRMEPYDQPIQSKRTAPMASQYRIVVRGCTASQCLYGMKNNTIYKYGDVPVSQGAVLLNILLQDSLQYSVS